MSPLTLLTVLRFVLTVSCVLGFGSAVTLTLNRTGVIADPEQARTYQGPIPPRRMLTRFGRNVHTVLLVSVALALVSVVAIHLLGPAPAG